MLKLSMPILLETGKFVFIMLIRLYHHKPVYIIERKKRHLYYNLM